MWKSMLLFACVLLSVCHAVAAENSESGLSFDALNASDSDTFSDSDIALVSTNVDILSNSSCCATGRCGGSCHRPRWRFAADALFLRRSTPDDRPLLVGDNAVAIGQNAADIDFSTDTGWRLTARRPLRAGYELDISYFDFNTEGMSPSSFDDQEAAYSYTVYLPVFESTPEGVNLRYVPEQRVRDLNGPFSHSYETHLDSMEINLRRSLGCSVNAFAGFRWIGLDESLIGRGSNGTFRHARSENDLYGFQIGADALLLNHCDGRLEWHGGLKTGVFGNHMRYSTVALEFSEGKSDDVAFCGELWLGGTYKLSQHLRVRAGYQVAWLSGVAVATKQPNDYVFGPPDAVAIDVNDDGGLSLQGAFVGMEYCR